MATRRPIVSVDGRKRQLPDGDRISGVPVSIHAYQQSGTSLRVWSSLDGAGLAVTKADGTTVLTLGVNLNG